MMKGSTLVNDITVLTAFKSDYSNETLSWLARGIL